MSTSQFTPFPPTTVVFRAAFKKYWFSLDGTKGAPPAFYRRPLTHPRPDHNGLSVDRSQEAIIHEMKREFYGFIGLEVGQIEGIGLAVKRDGDTHANIDDGIIELPFRDESDLKILDVCEAIAIRLADLSHAIRRVIPAKPKVENSN